MDLATLTRLAKINAPIGARIKQFRERKGLSRAELGRMVELAESSIFRLEKCETWPEYENLERIATALDVTVDAFFAGHAYVAKPSPAEALEVLREALRGPAIPSDITDRLWALPPDRRESVLNRVREILEVESPPPPGGGVPSSPGAKSPLRSKA